MTVHIRRYGQTLCGISVKVLELFLKHSCVDVREKNQVTCHVCKEIAEAPVQGQKLEQGQEVYK